jgi:CRISPR-associated endonuclease/helicase Cas3
LQINRKRENEIRHEFARHVHEAMLRAHEAHHQICPHSGKQVSFGLVRMANIEPLFDVALELFRLDAPEDYHIHLCVYHSRFPLILRSAIEQRLDKILNRRVPESVFALPEIRELLDNSPESHHLFVVLGSPVTEVGRDHDYDWAVVEPSSMRSLIQLAGRVQRHRNQRCQTPNIFIFDTNLRHFKPEKGVDGYPLAAFIYPGFESDARCVYDGSRLVFRLVTHCLGKLLHQDEYQTITARPRIQPRSSDIWRPKESLVDLEHARMQDTMMPRSSATDPEKPAELNAASVWQYPHTMLTWALPQQQRFRDNSMNELDLLFLPDDDEQTLILHRIAPAEGHGQPDLYVKEALRLEVIDLPALSGARITPWGEGNLLSLLQEQAQAQDLPLHLCAQRFTAVSVYKNTYGWRYHPALGFARKKQAG